MNDRFKFRVWDEIFKTYRNFTYFVNASDGTLGEVDDKDIYSFRNDTYLKREQCTGLKDKNGKLVYEGDLLKLSIQGYVQDNLFVVEDLRSFFFLLDREDPYYAVSWFEVVGNIHENSELLK